MQLSARIRVHGHPDGCLQGSSDPQKIGKAKVNLLRAGFPSWNVTLMRIYIYMSVFSSCTVLIMVGSRMRASAVRHVAPHNDKAALDSALSFLRSRSMVAVTVVRVLSDACLSFKQMAWLRVLQLNMVQSYPCVPVPVTPLLPANISAEVA